MQIATIGSAVPMPIASVVVVKAHRDPFRAFAVMAVTLTDPANSVADGGALLDSRLLCDRR
jgi:hypothetical protein